MHELLLGCQFDDLHCGSLSIDPIERPGRGTGGVASPHSVEGRIQCMINLNRGRAHPARPA